MPAVPVPGTIRVRMYQVGFGDCLLVSFPYPQPLAAILPSVIARVLGVGLLTGGAIVSLLAIMAFQRAGQVSARHGPVRSS